MAEPGQGFYPYQAAIEGYGNGGFRFAGMSHRGSLLCLPSGMHAWDARAPSDITRASLEPVFAAADQIDVLLVGLGLDIAGFDKTLRQELRERRIIVEAVATGGAVRTYNILLGENRAVGAALIAVESVPARIEIARKMGADHVVDFSKVDPVVEIMRLTDGRGVDVAIEALGRQQTFEAALRVLRPGGTLSSLGVYSGDLKIPLDAFAAGLADLTIVSTLCPGGKERMTRLMDVIASARADLRPLVTHRFKLDDIVAAYDLFSHQRDGVLKVAITP